MLDLIPELPPLKSLSGHDAYCKVCWEPVYRLWADKQDHGGVCPFGATQAHECRNAMNAARNTAMIREMMAQDRAIQTKESGHDQ